MTTDLLMTIKDIAEATRLTPRMINIYRADAEQRLVRKFGRKEGRTTYFDAEEVREILKSRDSNHAGNAGNASVSQNFAEASNFSQQNNQAEDSTLNGMEALVAANDQQAIAIGTAIGQRFTQVMWATAIGTMQTGTTQMLQQFAEMGSAIALPLNHQPALQGSDPSAARLEGYDG